MAVGEREQSDTKFEHTATLIVGGRRYEDLAVYGDQADPTRRDVFIPQPLRERYPNNLPKRADIEWEGRTYRAKKSFRRTRSGHAVPVYTWNVQG